MFIDEVVIGPFRGAWTRPRRSRCHRSSLLSPGSMVPPLTVPSVLSASVSAKPEVQGACYSRAACPQRIICGRPLLRNPKPWRLRRASGARYRRVISERSYIQVYNNRE
ncbi:hypothetical protein EVAR_39734_1 [Eumeta japonica]|uniref:Uncharacterized protein n=1 Tax=Eumeta variegata TaxID=151549 RepID=A0A4C1X2Q8_EUMVA|nr:hypothetical protein EVAR_39734_1 [Eumeta japonica]